MSFSWAVTDKSNKQPIPKPDTFRGYFTDIQRAARRSLPRQPDKELRQLLGLTLVPAGNEKARAQTINDQIQDKPKDVEKVQEPPAEAEVKIPDVKPSKKTFVEQILSKLPCRTKRQEECTEREKIISSFAVYFAIVIFILLMIVIILSAAISAIGKEDNDSSPSIDTSSQGNVSTFKPPIRTSASSNKVETQTATSTLPFTAKTDRSTMLSKLTALTTNIFRSTSKTATTSTQPSVPSVTEQTQTVHTTTTTAKVTQESTTPASRSSHAPSSTLSMVLTASTRTAVTTTSSGTRISTKSTPRSTTSAVTSLTGGNTTSSFRPRTETSSVTVSRSKSTKTSPTLSTQSRLTTVKNITIEKFSTGKTTQMTETTTTDGSTSKSFTTTARITVRNISTFTNSTIKQSSTSTSVSTSATTTAIPLPLLTKPVITCTTTSCLAARTTLNRVSFSTSPCVDFYGFACGDWINTTDGQKSDVSKRNVPSSLREQLRLLLLKQLQVLLQGVYYDTDSLTVRVSRRLYQACLESNINGDTELGDVERHKSLVELGEVMGDFGMTPQGDISATIEKLLLVSRSRFQITPFFKTSTVMLDDGNDGKVFGIEVSPPELYLGQANYKQPLETNRLAQLYITRVTEVLYTYLTSFNSNGIPGVPGTRRKKSLRNRRQSDGISYEEVYFKVQESFSIDLSIAKIIEETRNYSSPEVNDTIVMFTTMKDLFPNIDWDSALGARSASALIKITNHQYLESLDKLLPSLNEDNVKLYVFLSVLIQRVWNYMPYPLRNMIRDISTNNAIYSEIDCVEKTVELAHEETHALYIGQYTQEVLRNRLNTANLENTISQTFQTLVSQSEWIMSDLHRVLSVFLSNTKLVFSPVKAYIRETEGLRGAQQSFLSLALELHGQKHGYQSFLVTSTVDEDNIIQDWTSPDLRYESTLNLLTIPTGISVYLTNNDQTNFELHGYLGLMLAEQLIKVLTGEMINGVAPEWWGSENINRFQPIKDCFTKQMSQKTDPLFDLGKIIVSNGALQMIHEVFTRTTPLREEVIPNTVVTEEMLFFINTAQLECSVPAYSNHEVQQFSVNNRISNCQRFAEIFGCPKNSPMVTDQQCLVFT